MSISSVSFSSIAAVGVGASVGAVLRWQLSEVFNRSGAAISLGTLAANAIGAYVVGVCLAWFAQHPQLSAEWRLLLVTGFCGGLTTFSTFSAEVVALLQQGRTAAALGSVVCHVLVSLLLTFAGFESVRRFTGS